MILDIDLRSDLFSLTSIVVRGDLRPQPGYRVPGRKVAARIIFSPNCVGVLVVQREVDAMALGASISGYRRIAFDQLIETFKQLTLNTMAWANDGKRKESGSFPVRENPAYPSPSLFPSANYHPSGQ
jgi:hypothetical protein